MRIIIIGAGMTGLSAARILTQQGHDVIVLDKGRGVGGRMSTRTIEQAKADHGAQYFSVKSPEFKALIEELVSNNVAKEWQLAQRENIRYIGTKGMNSIPKKLAESLNVKLNEKVVTITGNTLKTESGNSYDFNNLIITIPIPQVIELLQNSNITPTENDQAVLNSIKYDPCIAVMAVLKQPTGFPSGGIILENQPVAWIADNFQKGITPFPTVTLHASADYSRNRLEDDLQVVSKEMLTSVNQYIPTDIILTSQVHRWRYSLARKRHESAFYQLENRLIFLAGDGFGIGNVEGAFLSGYEAATAIS
ncbi:NAD(P)/FAD-dependent oxidoreductase [Runella sp.]|uniref:NAD(P)/FAD-dependent oxidoreductase n=1 Tax=Runella sp. TaxID=1960881 RepID=UPI002633D941|nr:FAD-dependent oxidoreductase [Runella sp.]